jgi:hypothetical protein
MCIFVNECPSFCGYWAIWIVEKYGSISEFAESFGWFHQSAHSLFHVKLILLKNYGSFYLTVDVLSRQESEVIGICHRFWSF